MEYSLTELGQAANEALVPLDRWGHTNMAVIVANKEKAAAKTASV